MKKEEENTPYIIRKAYRPEDFGPEEMKKLKRWKKNKTLPRGYALQTLIALSHYPELEDIAIDFVFKKTDQPLSTKPNMASFLVSAENRRYQITISKEAKSTLQPVLLKNLTFNMQIGNLGHELGHVVDDLAKTSLDIINDGLLYGSEAHKRELERSVDMIACRHGFAWQQLEYAYYIEELQKKYPEETYYQDYFKCYMRAGELEHWIDTMNLYEDARR